MRMTTRIKRRIARIKAVWSELDYAQRRMFEIRTGIDPDDRLPPAVRPPYLHH